LPLGLGVAIYLSELAGERMRGIMKPTIELLAGIPSVVYGFFGLVVLVPIVQKTLNLPVGETAFTGSLILAIMALPTIITVAEDAMRNTPRTMREASLALGATNWQTIYRVIIPYSASGISAAVVLGIGRAIGETMAVLMVTGNAAAMPTSLFQSVRTIPATIAAELGEAPAKGSHYQALFMLGCILFVITMIISITAEAISKKQHNKGYQYNSPYSFFAFLGEFVLLIRRKFPYPCRFVRKFYILDFSSFCDYYRAPRRFFHISFVSFCHSRV